MEGVEQSGMACSSFCGDSREKVGQTSLWTRRSACDKWDIDISRSCKWRDLAQWMFNVHAGR